MARSKKSSETKPASDVQRYCCLFDLHYAEYDHKTFRAILQFLKANPVTGIVLGGDNLDFSELSHHNAGKYILKPTGALRKNLNGFDKHILKPLEEVVPSDAVKIWFDGNHERFLQDWIDQNPEMSGMVSHIDYLRLKERGWECIKQGRERKIGKLTCLHGDTLTGGASAAKKAVETYGCNVLLGHFHNPQSYCRTSPVNRRHKFCGWVAPIVGSVNAKWTRRRANNWVNGFVLVELRSGGRFSLYPIFIIDGEFSFGGVVYRG